MGRHGPGQHRLGRGERARDARGTLQRLWGYLARERRALVATAAMVALGAGLSLLGPFLLSRAVDQGILPGDMRRLAAISALMLAVYAAAALLAWLQGYVMAGASQRTVRAIRADLAVRLQQLPLRFLDQRAHGDLMSRLTNDVENINMVLADSVTQIVSGVLSMVGVAAAMLVLNARLAAVSISAVVLSTLLMNRWIARRTRDAFRGQQAALGALNGLIEETVSGQRVVKAYHREAAALEGFDAANAELRAAATRAQTYAGLVGPLMNGSNNLSLAIVAGLGGVLAAHSLATVGTVAGFISYSRQFGRPLNEIASLYNAIQAAMAGAERVFEVLDETPERDREDSVPLPRLRGEVELRGVSFSYDGKVTVLRDVDLHARPGQLIALVGPTGAGKTTIVNLLTRFYDIDAGEIRVDGIDIRHVRREDLRRQLGIVLQDTYLFSGTIRDNIRYGRLDATDEEVIAAAVLANADQFIHRLPHGYDSLLSERASNLSHGQRQLIAIARAILADPAVLILDEATSSVDTRTEKHIQQAMARLMAGRTSLVIAHRLSTVRDADEILVIDQGEVIERGTHEELLARRGFYARLHDHQFAGGGPPPDERSSATGVSC
ncbi:MAG: ABC transporter ATP-binding protein [Chthonomonadales bacterium]|nr:ABC transporter ATP-binding protein [Chthonomonadales bacterium]